MKSVLKLKHGFDFGETRDEQATNLWEFRRELSHRGIRSGIRPIDDGQYMFFGNSLSDIQDAVSLYYDANTDINDDFDYKYVVNGDNKSELKLTDLVLKKLSKIQIIDKLVNAWFMALILMILYFIIVAILTFNSLPNNDIIKHIVLPAITGGPVIILIGYICYAIVKTIKLRKVIIR